MFYFEDFCGRKILKSDILKSIDCFFTTKEFTLCAGSLPELEKTAQKNRELLKTALGCSDIITAKQVHGCNIEIVRGNKYIYDNTDALISNTPDTLMLLNFADCTPIILYSKKDRAGAVIHAGWRGTALEISYKTVLKMKKELNIEPENITALIGPAIGKCCFETGREVFEQLIKDKNIVSRICHAELGNILFLIFPPLLRRGLGRGGSISSQQVQGDGLICHAELSWNCFRSSLSFLRRCLPSFRLSLTGLRPYTIPLVSASYDNLYEIKNGKYFIDLKLLNYKQLASAGVKNIDICSYCTFCMSDIFYSYRKENGITARHSAVIKI